MATLLAAQHVMEIIDESGDLKVTWDVDNEGEVEAARKTFDDMKRKGYLAYKVNKKGDKGEVITEFDEDLERIIMAPQLRGG